MLQEIIVKPGETIWGIANTYLQNPERWPELLKYNQLPGGDPNAVLPGMKLKVPVLLIKGELRAAEVTYIQNEVLFRRRQESDWKPAAMKLQLLPEDGLRTLVQALARLRFPNGEQLSVDENTLLVVRPQEKKQEAELLSGGLRASRVKVITPKAKIVPEGDDADFKTTYEPEAQKTTVAVYRGRARFESGSTSILVPSGFMSEARANLAPAVPTALPTPPALSGNVPGVSLSAPGLPADAAVSRGESLALSALLSARPTPGAVRYYHVQVARDAAFRDVVLDRIQPEANLEQLGLSEGRFLWRVATVNGAGIESPFTQARPLVVDRTPPVSALAEPVEGARSGSPLLHVRGSVEPGATLTVAGRPTPVGADGRFDQVVALTKGPNTLFLVARDAAGNEANARRIVEGLVGARAADVAAAQGRDPSAIQKSVLEEIRRPGGPESGGRSVLSSILLGVLTGGVIVGVLVLLLL